jgi:hypothetical protein
MNVYLLRSRHLDGSGDPAPGSSVVSLSDMIERAYGSVRSSMPLSAATSAPAATRLVDGYEAEDIYDAEVATLGGHLAAVEAVLYPVARRHLAGGRAAVAAQQRLDRRIERLMRLIEGRFYGDAYAIDMKVEQLQDQLAQLVEVSRRTELDLARRLDRTLTTAHRAAVADSFAAAMAHAPTRPHPYLPHSMGLGKLSFRVSALWDRALDVMDNRTVPGTTPPRRPKRRLTLWDRYVLAPSFDETTQREPQRPRPVTPEGR